MNDAGYTYIYIYVYIHIYITMYTDYIIFCENSNSLKSVCYYLLPFGSSFLQRILMDSWVPNF